VIARDSTEGVGGFDSGGCSDGTTSYYGKYKKALKEIE